MSITDEAGAVLLDAFVKPTAKVTDLRTNVTGIRHVKQLLAGMSFEDARAKVLELLDGKLLVGHSLKNDFRVLGLTHPFEMIRDTAAYKPLRPKGAPQRTPSLRNLVSRLAAPAATGCAGVFLIVLLSNIFEIALHHLPKKHNSCKSVLIALL